MLNIKYSDSNIRGKMWFQFVVVTYLTIIVGAMSRVTCDKTFTAKRVKLRQSLMKQQVIFWFVAYYPLESQNFKLWSTMKRMIQRYAEVPQMPISLVQPITGHARNFSHLVVNTQDAKAENFLNFDSESVELFNDDSTNNELPLYIFSTQSRDPEVTQSETLIFHGCRMNKNQQGLTQVQKVMVTITTGKLDSNLSSIIKNRMKTIKMNVFKTNEFQDQDFGVCDHLDFYINECRSQIEFYEPYALIVIAILIVIGLIIMSFYDKIIMAKETIL